MKNSKIVGAALMIAIVLGIVIMLPSGFIFRLVYPLGRHEVVERVFKSQEIFDVMMNSQQVTAQRLHLKSDLNLVLLSGYTEDAPVTLRADQAQQIKGLLQNPSSYLWDVRSCLPNYGVVYNFQTAGQTVHVAFCFKCNVIGVFNGDNDASNSINFTSQFNPMRGEMIALAKTLFLNDSEIQSLK